MKTLNLLVAMGFAGTCASFVGVFLVNRQQLGIGGDAAAVILVILIGVGWAWMMNRINIRVGLILSRLESNSKRSLLFWGLIGLDLVLIAIGSTMGWALIPALRMMHVFA